MRYQILPWLGSGRQVSRQQLDTEIARLLREQKVTVADHQVLLTPEGAEAKCQFEVDHYQPQFLDSYLHFNIAQVLQRFLLAGQVVSEFSYHNRQYAPFSFDEDELRAVKYWFSRQNKDSLVTDFKLQLSQFLRMVPDREASVVVLQMIGHQQAGASLTQLGEQLKINSNDLQVIQRDLFGGLAQYVHQQQQGVLFELVQPLWRANLSSKSAKESYRLFTNGLSVPKISSVRHLKAGTIREHLLEVAIFAGASFPYHQILDQEKQVALKQRFEHIPIDEWHFDGGGSAAPAEFFYFRLYQIMRSFEVGS